MCMSTGFQVHPTKVTKASSAWAQKLLDDDTYTYPDCVKWPQIMAHHVKSLMRAGDSKGYPRIDAEKGDVPPDGSEVYDATTTVTSYKPHMTKPHAELPFLRAAPLNDAIEYVRNEGFAPIQVQVL